MIQSNKYITKTGICRNCWKQIEWTFNEEQYNYAGNFKIKCPECGEIVELNSTKISYGEEKDGIPPQRKNDNDKKIQNLIIRTPTLEDMKLYLKKAYGNTRTEKEIDLLSSYQFQNFNHANNISIINNQLKGDLFKYYDSGNNTYYIEFNLWCETFNIDDITNLIFSVTGGEQISYMLMGCGENSFYEQVSFSNEKKSDEKIFTNANICTPILIIIQMGIKKDSFLGEVLPTLSFSLSKNDTIIETVTFNLNTLNYIEKENVLITYAIKYKQSGKYQLKNSEVQLLSLEQARVILNVNIDQYSQYIFKGWNTTNPDSLVTDLPGIVDSSFIPDYPVIINSETDIQMPKATFSQDTTLYAIFESTQIETQ